jgi:hypothetical protein
MELTMSLQPDPEIDEADEADEAEETFEFTDDEGEGSTSQCYENFIREIWTNKLMAEFDRINDIVEINCKKRLKYPVFAITPDMGRWWGMWHPDTRMLRLNEKLFRNFEWGAVQRVLRHEMGHMVVSEIFNFEPHGCCVSFYMLHPKTKIIFKNGYFQS